MVYADQCLFFNCIILTAVICHAQIVYVDHDLVAKHCYRFNHDAQYNPDLPDDGIEYAFLDSFEEFEDSFNAIMEAYGRAYLFIVSSM